MRGWFTSPRSTSHDHTAAQVNSTAEDRVVGRREVASSVASGKSLAGNPAWSAVLLHTGRTLVTAIDIALDGRRTAGEQSVKVQCSSAGSARRALELGPCTQRSYG